MDLDGAAVDDQFSIFDLHGSLEPPVGGVILEQVGLYVMEVQHIITVMQNLLSGLSLPTSDMYRKMIANGH